MKKSIIAVVLVCVSITTCYDKVCRELAPNIRYAHPFNGQTIDYHFSLGTKEGSNYPTICYVHLSDEDKKILWQKLSDIKNKVVDKELQESFSSDSVVSKVLADFKEMRKYETKRFTIVPLTVRDVLDRLKITGMFR
jgi:hypothetical protein